MNLYMNAQNISFEPITIRIIYNLEANMWINNSISLEKRIPILKINGKSFVKNVRNPTSTYNIT